MNPVNILFTKEQLEILDEAMHTMRLKSRGAVVRAVLGQALTAIGYDWPEDANTWGGNRLAVERAEVAKRGLPPLAGGGASGG
jgi:hypothetical protein